MHNDHMFCIMGRKTSRILFKKNCILLILGENINATKLNLLFQLKAIVTTNNMNSVMKGFCAFSNKEGASVLLRLIPGHADVADVVGHVAGAGEALLYIPLGLLAAALAPGGQGASAG